MTDCGENTPLMQTSYHGGWYGYDVGAPYRTDEPTRGAGALSPGQKE